MPTRKQRKRMQKERRHEYETVWVDGDGNELEEPPDDAPRPAPRERRPEGKNAKPQQKRPQQRSSSRATRTPLPPSWRRAMRRSLLLGAVILVFIYISSHRVGSALLFAVLYTAIFIPFTYGLDRFAYRRWERNNAKQPTKR